MWYSGLFIPLLLTSWDTDMTGLQFAPWWHWVPVLLVSVSALMPVKQPCHEHQPFVSLPTIRLCVYQELFIIADLFIVGSSVPSSLPICLPDLPHTTLHGQPRHWAQRTAVRNWSIMRQTWQKTCAFSAFRHAKRLSQEAVLAKWVFPLVVKVSFPSKAETFCEVFPAERWLQPQLQTAQHLHSAGSLTW